MRIKNLNMLENATEDLSANFASKPLYLGHVGMYSIQSVFTGTPTGTFKLQCSNDYAEYDSVNVESYAALVTNWSDIAGSSQAVSAAGDLMYNVENVGYTWVRLVWTFSSSTGTLTNCRAMTKGF